MSEEQAAIDESMMDDQIVFHNLKTFKILYYVKAGLNLSICLIPVFWAGLFSFMPEEAFNDPNQPPIDVKEAFLTMGILIIAFSVLLAFFTVMAGRYIGDQKNKTFIYVLAVLNALSGILGLLLCIFTFIELGKPHVSELFKVSNKQSRQPSF